MYGRRTINSEYMAFVVVVSRRDDRCNWLQRQSHRVFNVLQEVVTDGFKSR